MLSGLIFMSSAVKHQLDFVSFLWNRIVQPDGIIIYYFNLWTRNLDFNITKNAIISMNLGIFQSGMHI